MANALRFTEWRVHCRTGSLENLRQRKCHSDNVHCCTGSLEKLLEACPSYLFVHCRTGSLENHERHCSPVP
ncbi:hypothetical protein AC598_17690 [Yersinia pestis subsp. microtus bv. Caucasica]|nr:hypothetical protein AC598_17690 [Yersinia pestis subsp. microtus bv. Caucasica]